MRNMGDIIKEKRIEMNMTQEELGARLGVQKSAIAKYENGRVENLKRSVIQKLAEILEVTPTYLMGLEDPDPQTVSLPSHSYILIPESVHAGSPFTIEAIRDEDLPQILIPDILLGKHAGNRDIVAMKVNGESMNNVIPNGSYIAIWVGEEMPELRDDDIVVFSNNGEYSLKRFYDDKANERLIFRPDSSDRSFTDIIYNYDDLENFKIIGKVIMYCVSL